MCETPDLHTVDDVPRDDDDCGCVHVCIPAYVEANPAPMDLVSAYPPELVFDDRPNFKWTDTFPSYHNASMTDALPAVYLVIRVFRQGDGYGREIYDARRTRDDANRSVAAGRILVPNNHWGVVEYVPTI